MSEFAEHDEEDDKAWNPANHLVHVDDFVAEQRDDEGTRGNNDDSSVARQIRVDSVKELCANNYIHRRPTQTGETVENCD